MSEAQTSSRVRRGRPRSTDTLPRVEAVERALSLLTAFQDGTPRLALSELSARTALWPSTVLRLSGSLIRAGFLRRDAAGYFALGPAPLRLGALYRAGFDLPSFLRPALLRLVAATGETAAFYIRDGSSRVCLVREHPPRALRTNVDEGAVLPLDRGASAHVLRGFAGGTDPRAAEARRLGAAHSLGERDAELAGVAVPLHGPGGVFLGALGFTGPRARIEPALDQLEAALRSEAAALESAMGV